MAAYEVVSFDLGAQTLRAPNGADTYILKKSIHLEQSLTTISTVDGRDVSADGGKLDLITVTQTVNLDEMENAINGLGAVVVLKGSWDARTNAFPISTLAGESWLVEYEGTVAGIDFKVNDRITAIVDGASTTVYIGQWLRQAYTDAVTKVAGRIGDVVLVETDITDLQGYLLPASIDSLAKLNAYILDATLGDSADFATAAQGTLAATALQDADLDSLAKLNALVLDAALDDSSAARTPTAHTHTQSDITDLADPAVTPVSTPTYNVLDADSLLHVTYTSTGAVTSLTLMNDQAIDGRRLIIKDAGGNAATNNITVDTEGSQTIDGAATKVMVLNYESITVYCDGINWFVL